MSNSTAIPSGQRPEILWSYRKKLEKTFWIISLIALLASYLSFILLLICISTGGPDAGRNAYAATFVVGLIILGFALYGAIITNRIGVGKIAPLAEKTHEVGTTIAEQPLT